MVVDDFDLVRVSVFPDEADAPLVVDANAVLTFPFSAKRFEAISRRHSQVIQDLGCRKLRKLPKRRALNIRRQLARVLAVPDLLRLFTSEVLDLF